MRFLVRFLSPPNLPRDKFLASVRALARSAGVEPRNPKWTSHGALELDMFCPTKADFELFLSASSPLYKLEFFRDLNKAPSYRSEEEVFAEAREYFNSERYWECHEVLEGVWRLNSGAEKHYLQGIILVCAAFVHHQKGEDEVALSVLQRAVAQLEFPSTRYHGFDVRLLRQSSNDILRNRRFSEFRV
jgi:predicted metal-dependent hydrolase